MFVACYAVLPVWAKDWLSSVCARGATLVWSGLAQPFADLAGLRVVHEVTGHPLHALAWLHRDGSPSLIAPPGWKVAEFEGGEPLCTCATVGGERQTPVRAALQQLKAPLAQRQGPLIYLNGDPFAAFQCWLQGHADLNPWLGWRHRFYWLDEQAVTVLDLLRTLGVDMERLSRAGIPALGELTVVLRHDLDSSRDTAYLDEEVVAGIPGVHAALLDRNTGFWRNAVTSRTIDHELAFHYNTIRQPLWWRLATRLGIPEPAYRPAVGEIVGTGLLKQTRRARRRGIPIETLHRHGPFILYPESILALDDVFRCDSRVIGSSSWFRGAVLRWGCDRVDGVRGSMCDAPDIQFPFAFPFRLCDASDGGRLLDGWEATCLIEPEPGLVAQMLDYRPREIRQRMVVLNYHPAHARRPTFAQDGSLPWFRDTLALLRERGVAVLTMASVFRAVQGAVIDRKKPFK